MGELTTNHAQSGRAAHRDRDDRRGEADVAGRRADADTGVRAWPGIAVHAVKAGLGDGVMNLSASLTYYALLSLFPAVIFVVALLALVGQASTTRVLLDIAGQVAPPSAVDTVRGPVENLIASRGASQTLLSLGIVVAVFSASGFVGAFMWAANRIHDVPGLPFLKKLPRQIVLALVLLVAMGIIATVVVLTGPIARTIGSSVGLADQAVATYSVLRWPLLFVLAMLLFSVLYAFAPNAPGQSLRWISAGAFFGAITALIATFGFTMYVGTLGNYNATYGALAGVVVFLVWLWIFNIALLLGVEFNVEVQRRKGDARNRSSKSAQHIWIEVHDNAVEEYGEGERAHRTAWAALKKDFKKDGDHWVSRSRSKKRD